MKVIVFGAGAVGTFLGVSLSAAGHDVVLVCRPDAALSIASEGAAILLPGEASPALWANPVVTSSLAAAWANASAEVDLIILAMKSYDVGAALDELQALPTSPAPLLAIQNGIGLEESIQSRFPNVTLTAGSVTIPLSREGRATIAVERTGRGMTLAPTRPGQEVSRLAGYFRGAGIATSVVADHLRLKWSKALLNMIGNATAAILDMHPGNIYRHRAGFQLELAMLQETVSVMTHKGIPVINLPGSPAERLAQAMRWLPAWALQPFLAFMVRRGRGSKLPSFLIDLRAGKPRSEVEFHNGAVAAAGAEIGVSTPVNISLNRILSDLVAGRIARSTYAGQPAALMAAVAQTELTTASVSG